MSSLETLSIVWSQLVSEYCQTYAALGKNINTSKHRYCSESRKIILADPIKPFGAGIIFLNFSTHCI